MSVVSFNTVSLRKLIYFFNHDTLSASCLV
nr:MAG TPA: hypothetical protein [Caudoviricetes sp.]